MYQSMNPIRLTKKSVDLSLLHPRFLARLENFFKDSRVEGHVAVSSGCRSYAEQKRLYEKYKAGRGNLAANPDWKRPDGFFRGSFHQEQPDGYSYAVDLSAIGGVSKPTITRIAADYGLLPTVKGEWWHFQPRDGTDWFRQSTFTENYTTEDGHTPHPNAVPMDWAGLIALHAACGRTIALSPIRRGSRGIEVTMIQKRLNALDFWCGTADGIFGWKTKSAVKRFQRAMLHSPNGVVTSAVWTALWDPKVVDGL
jgi:hypothetical protein